MMRVVSQYKWLNEQTNSRVNQNRSEMKATPNNIQAPKLYRNECVKLICLGFDELRFKTNNIMQMRLYIIPFDEVPNQYEKYSNNLQWSGNQINAWKYIVYIKDNWWNVKWWIARVRRDPGQCYENVFHLLFFSCSFSRLFGRSFQSHEQISIQI